MSVNGVVRSEKQTCYSANDAKGDGLVRANIHAELFGMDLA